MGKNIGGNAFINRVFRHDSILATLSRKFRTSLVVWTDAFGIPFGPFPVRQKMCIALGPAIECEKVENPTDEQVAAVQKEYLAALKALFDRHKHRVGYGHKTLIFEDETAPEMTKKEQ